jgi:hypothetical protein
VLKLRIALCLALIVGTLTLINGIVYDARLETILYRVLTSIVLFGVLGYILGAVGERLYRDLIAKYIVDKKQEEEQEEDGIDTLHEQEIDNIVNSESEFSPFASSSFEQISRPK